MHVAHAIMSLTSHSDLVLLVQHHLGLRGACTFIQILSDVGPYLYGLFPHLSSFATRHALNLALLEASGCIATPYTLRAGTLPPGCEQVDIITARALEELANLPGTPNLNRNLRILLHEALLCGNRSFDMLANVISPYYALLTGGTVSAYRAFYATVKHTMASLHAKLVVGGTSWSLTGATPPLPMIAVESALCKLSAMQAQVPVDPAENMDDGAAALSVHTISLFCMW